MPEVVPRPANEGRSAGIAMLAAIALGMAAANSPLSAAYTFIDHFPLRLGTSRNLPSGTSLRDMFSAALLAGIGFTMSLFIVTAALDDLAREDAAKLAVVVGSSLSAILASVALLTLHRMRLS